MFFAGGGGSGGAGRIRLQDDDGAVAGFDTSADPDATVGKNW